MRKEFPSTRWFTKWKIQHISRNGFIFSTKHLHLLHARATELYRLGATPSVAGSATAKEQLLASKFQDLKGKVVQTFFCDRVNLEGDWTKIPSRGKSLQPRLF